MNSKRNSGLLPMRRSTELSVSLRSPSTTTTRSSVRFLGSMVVSLSWLAILSPSPLKRPISTLAVARRHRQVEMAIVDQLRRLAVEEGDQQRGDVRAVDVGVGHDDDLFVAQ